METIKLEIKDLNAKRLMYINSMLEGGEGYNPFDDKIDDLFEKLSILEKENEIKEWTEDTTAKRRKIWNNLVNNGMIKNIKEVLVQQRKLGWKMDTLKKYINLYK